MNPPKVSIILPFHNADRSVEARMGSVLGQTFADVEVLCVDAGADEETRERLAQYAQEDARVKLLRSDANSMGAAKNLAISSASGDYIGFVEAGDDAVPEMYESLVRFADAHPQADIVKSDYVSFEVLDGKRFFDPRTVLGTRKADYEKILNPRKHSYLFGIDKFHGAGIYRRKFLNDYKIRHHETSDAGFSEHGFWFQSLALARGVAFLPTALYHHRRRDSKYHVDGQDKFAMCAEYDFAEQRVRNYRGIMEAVWQPYLRNRYEACAWALRTAEQADWPEIVHRMHEDFSKRMPDSAAEKIYSPILYRRLHKELKLLLQQPAEYQAYIQKQKKAVDKQRKTLAAWAARKRTVICGAGTLGRKAQILLAELGTFIDAFVEDAAAKNGEIVNGIKVQSLPQFGDVRGCQFLIAKESGGSNAKQQLQEAGVEDDDIKRFELHRLF